jgi:DNA-binding CsgD family transcriptional regulator
LKVFVTAPRYGATPDSVFHVDADQAKLPLVATDPHHAESLFQHEFLQAVVEGLLDGVMIVTAEQEIVQSNLRARQLCRRLNSRNSDKPALGQVEMLELPLPSEIWRVCQAAIESYELFPDREIVPESELMCGRRTRLRIRAQRIEMSDEQDTARPSVHRVLVTLEDRGQSIQNLAIADMKKFELTAREGQIWQLRLAGRSYREIATELYITDNTVKKHIKSILSKRRAVLDDE